MITKEQKQEAQAAIFDLRAYYPLHVIAATCNTDIGKILDIINGHHINMHLWDDIYTGAMKLYKEIKK